MGRRSSWLLLFVYVAFPVALLGGAVFAFFLQAPSLANPLRVGDVAGAREALRRGASPDELMGASYGGVSLRTSAFGAAVLRGDTLMVKVFLENGVSVNERIPVQYPAQSAGWSYAVILAAQALSEGVVTSSYLSWFLERDADPNLFDHYGHAAIFVCAAAGSSTAVRELLTHGADISMVTNDEMNVLHPAVIQGNRVLVDFLLLHGADLFQVDRFGKSPLAYARQSGDPMWDDLLEARPE
jgi:hypothetical protein